MNKLTDETKDFQPYILKRLAENDYEIRDQSEYDRKFAIDRDALFRFLYATQPESMAKLEKIFKGETRETVVAAINAEENGKNGSRVGVLKKGVTLSNIHLDLSYYKPTSTINQKAQKLYQSNIFSVMKEVYASDEERIDLVVFLNGLAIFAFELKSETSGQNYQNAIEQYRTERNPETRLFQFKSGVLAAFAMDTQEVYMTSKLDGKSTFFLPFNQGNGEGVLAGKGNPVCENDYSVRYMWNEILQKDVVLEIIWKFVFVEYKEKTDAFGKKKKEVRVVFPRYHQLDLIRKLVADVRVNRTSLNYLLQHSAGSGKTYEIAWLAYRLASLHDENNVVVFNKIVVCTDRVVVDRQLQAAIRMLEPTSGYVRVMNEGCTSADLADALKGGAKIICTTIQKFPYIVDMIDGLKNETFGVIIDESHSSTAGKTMTALTQTLSSEEDKPVDIDEIIMRQIKGAGKQKNVSLFGFTATPKPTTLQLFGRLNSKGQMEAFHIYSMRQAIEEGFILDVLQNYVTYKTLYELNKKIDEDPKYDKKKAKRQIARFVELHPTNIEQRVEIIVEHFREKVMPELGGQAKAMVVTSSREGAVAFKLATDKYLIRKGYKDLQTLVAFSGKVRHEEKEYTEAKMNGFPEKNLPRVFDGNEYQVLIVADKYQTGFDQRKLCAMYVLKKLRGVNAVQTLSRLNRVCPPFDDKKTFVLDFANDYDDMQKAFAPYYTATLLANSVTPGSVYALEAKIDGWLMIDPQEIEEFNEAVLSDKRPAEIKRKVEAKLQRMKKFIVATYSSEEQLDIVKKVRHFIRCYEFLIQATSLVDVQLHKKYVYLTYLLAILDINQPGAGFNLDGKIKANFFRQKKTSEHVGEKVRSNPIVRLPEAERVEVAKPELARLSEIIAEINSRYGSEFDADVTGKAIMQIFALLMKQDKMRKQARNNSFDAFELAYNEGVEGALTEGLEQNQDFYTFLLNNKEERERIFGILAKNAYDLLREE